MNAAPSAPSPVPAGAPNQPGISAELGPHCKDLIERMPTPAFCCDAAGAIVFYNHAAETLWGEAPPANLPGTWCGSHAIAGRDGQVMERAQWPACAAVAAGHDLDGIEAVVVRADGERRQVLAHAQLTRSREGAVLGVLCILVDVSARRVLEDELRHVEQERNDFLAMLAHELRNPLSPILSAATVLRRGGNGAHVERLAHVVERQARQLSRFVTDLLDASRLSHGGIPVHKQAASLDDVVERALDVVRDKARARGQTMRVHGTHGGVTLLCDPARLAQAIGNLLLNASDFTADRDAIELRVAVDGGMLEIDVLDQGIGIAPERVDAIFNVYAQFEKRDERLRSGAGLGLALARNVCQQHGGAISVHSQGVGHGSRFRMVLPIVRQGPEPA